MRLNLSKQNDTDDRGASESKKDDLTAARDVGGNQKKAAVSFIAATAPKIDSTSAGQQSTGSVFFVYNGHEWEAHQVLGVPRSCTLAEATAHYQHLVKTADLSTLEFYESAHLAIIQSKSTRVKK